MCAGSAMRSQAPSVRRAQSTGHASWPGHGVRAPAFRPPGGRLLRSEPESLGLRRPFSDVTAGTGWGVRSVARGAGAGGRCTLTYLHEDGGVRERRRLGVCAPGFSAAPAPSSAAGRARTGALRAFSAAAALADVHVTHGREHAGDHDDCRPGEKRGICNYWLWDHPPRITTTAATHAELWGASDTPSSG